MDEEEPFGFEKIYHPKKVESIKEVIHLYEKTKWVLKPVIYWSGNEIYENIYNTNPVFPLSYQIYHKLVKSKPGLYSLKINFPTKNKIDDINFSDFEINCIDLEKLSNTLNSLIALRKYPKLSRKYIADFDLWKDKVEERLKIIFEILKMLESKDTKDIDHLLIERFCIWIGDDNKRPSKKISSQALINYLKSEKERNKYLSQAIYFVMGKRQVHYQPLSDEYGKWINMGRILSSIPTDIAFYILDNRENFGDILEAFKVNPQLNSEDIYYFLFELLFLAENNLDIIKLIPHINNLNDTLKKVEEENFRRFRFLKYYIDNILNKMIAEIMTYKSIKIEKIQRSILEIFEINFYSEIENAKENVISFFDYSENKEKKILFINLFSKLLIHSKRNLNLFFGDLHEKNLLNELKDLFAKDNKIDLNILNEKESYSNSFKQFKHSAFALASKIFSICNDYESISYLSMWMEKCRNLCPLGVEKLDHIKFPLDLINKSIIEINPSKYEVKKLIELLGKFGDLIVLDLLKELTQNYLQLDYNLLIKTLKNRLNILKKIKILEVEDYEYIFKNNLNFVFNVENISDDHIKKFINLHKKYLKVFNFTMKNDNLAHEIFYKLDLFSIIIELFEKNQKIYKLSEEAIFYLLSLCLENIDTKKLSRDTIKYLFLFIADEIQKIPDEEIKKGDVFREFIIKFECLIGFAKSWNSKYFEKKEFINKFYNLLSKGNLSDYYIECLATLSEDERIVLCEISDGDINKFIKLIPVVSKFRYIDFAGKSFEYLNSFKEIKEFLISLKDFPEFSVNIFKLLEKVDYILRFKMEEELKKEFLNFIEVEKKESIQKYLLESIKFYYEISGKAELSKELQKALNKKQSLIKERNYLISLKGKGNLPEEKRIRLEKLEKILSSENYLNQIFSKNISKILKKQLILAKINALNSILDDTKKKYYKKLGFNICGDIYPELDYAMMLYSEIRINKKILKKLIIKESKGEKNWIENMPKNIEFSTKFKKNGGNSKEWQNKYEMIAKFKDNTWKIYTETEPLKILQAGKYTHTCINPLGEYNYTPIAYAVEKNKKVIYIENEDGKVVARRFICINEEKNLFAFPKYTIFYSISQKDYNDLASYLFDLIILIIANESNLTIKKELSFKLDSLNLFSSAYYDKSFNNFSSWVYEYFSEEENLVDRDFMTEFIRDPLSNFVFFTDFKNKNNKIIQARINIGYITHIFNNLVINRKS